MSNSILVSLVAFKCYGYPCFHHNIHYMHSIKYMWQLFYSCNGNTICISCNILSFHKETPNLFFYPRPLQMIQLTIRTLPSLPLGAKYQCVWGTAPPMDAQVTSSGLTCPVLHSSRRPSIPPHTDHTLVPLAVRSSETNKDFVSRNFAFYDCSRHSTCGSCVKSAWACNWCVYENICTHNSSIVQQGTVVSGETRQSLPMTAILKDLVKHNVHSSLTCNLHYSDMVPLT